MLTPDRCAVVKRFAEWTTFQEMNFLPAYLLRELVSYMSEELEDAPLKLLTDITVSALGTPPVKGYISNEDLCKGYYAWQIMEVWEEIQPIPHSYCPNCHQYKPVKEFCYGAADGRCNGCLRIAEWLTGGNVDPPKASMAPSGHPKMTTAMKTQAGWEQEGKCKTCGAFPERGKPLHADHDHTCCPKGSMCVRCFRGMLCSRCNFALGWVYDNVTVLRALITHLEDHRNALKPSNPCAGLMGWS
jgi:hypothetical protein